MAPWQAARHKAISGAVCAVAEAGCTFFGSRYGQDRVGGGSRPAPHRRWQLRLGLGFQLGLRLRLGASERRQSPRRPVAVVGRGFVSLCVVLLRQY